MPSTQEEEEEGSRRLNCVGLLPSYSSIYLSIASGLTGLSVSLCHLALVY